jgi:N6-adenosine-specific RNA methylase IME4
MYLATKPSNRATVSATHRNYFRNSTEHVLFGVRGHLRTRVDNIPTHFEAPRLEHSEKPERFYEIVRAASYPSP